MRLMTLMLATAAAMTAAADERAEWDQEEAVAKVQKVLDTEAAGRPWDDIDWVTDPAEALRVATEKGRPIVVYYYLRKEATGPRDAPCCAGGRLTRALVLSEEAVQKRLAEEFVPFRLEIKEGTASFPSDWRGLKHMKIPYQLVGGEDCQGITGLAVVSPDGQTLLAATDSCFVWELFDSSAYSPAMFGDVLDRGLKFHAEANAIAADETLSELERRRAMLRLRGRVKKANNANGGFRLPPKGFSVDGAKELFVMSGDLDPEE